MQGRRVEFGMDPEKVNGSGMLRADFVQLTTGAAFALGCGAALAQEIYVSTGEHGEVSFSDVAGPGAEPVTLAAPAPSAEPEAELEQRIRQTLAVADALEASRLAREQARAEARAAGAAARAAVTDRQAAETDDDRYSPYPYLFVPRHRPPPHGGPGGEPPPEPAPEDTVHASPFEWRQDAARP